MKLILVIPIFLLVSIPCSFSQVPLVEVEGEIITTGLTDKDGDTKIELKEATGEDTIVFHFEEEKFQIYRSEHGQVIFAPINYARGLGVMSKSKNSFFGYNAGINTNPIIFEGEFNNETSAIKNSFFGYRAGNKNIEGSNNSFFGSGAGFSLRDGVDNVFIGRDCGGAWYSGNNNIFIGSQAGSSNTFSEGSGNVYIGNQAGFNSEEDNQLIIENSNDISTPLIYGEFDNDIVEIHGELQSEDIELTTQTSNPASGHLYKNSGPLAYGYISKTGSITTDYGISTVTNVLTDEGKYEILLDNEFTVNPVVLVTPYSTINGGEFTATYFAEFPNKITVHIINENGIAEDEPFSIMVMGW